MECGHRPRNVPTSPKRATGGKSKLDLNDGSRRDALGGRHAQATQTDIGAATERCDRFSVEGREVQPCVERDPFCVAPWFSMGSSRAVHSRVRPIGGLLNLSAGGALSLECKSNVTSHGSAEPGSGFPPVVRSGDRLKPRRKRVDKRASLVDQRVVQAGEWHD